MPVYSIQGPDGKVYTIEGPAGATKEQVVAAIQAKMAQGTAASPEPVAPPAPPSTERTWAQAGTDLGASLLSGVGNVLQVPGQIAQLLPGLQGFGQTIAKPGEYVEELGQGLKSQGLKVREALRSQAMSEAEKEGILSAFATAISQTIKDPALLSTFITEQLPMLIGPAAAARVAKGVVMSRSALEGAELAAAAGKAGTRAAIGAGALMQGADISSDAYKQALDAAKAQGMTEEQANEAALTAARKAFGISAPISILSQGLLSKVGGTSIERALAGLPGGGRLRGAFGEATQEAIEEGGGAFATNVGVRGVDPTRSLTEGIGSAAGLGTIGGGILGGIIGGPAPKVERPNAAADQEILALQGETLALQQARDELARAQAQAEALEAQKAAAEAAKPKVLDRSGLDALISQPYGYADVMLYREGLRNALEADPGNREVQAAIKIADASLKERGIEDAQRKEKAQETLSSKDLASFGINSGTVLYKQLVGKNLADEDQRQQIRDDLTAFKAQKGVKPDQAKKADSVLSYLENYEQTRFPYGRKTAPSGDVAETGGAGAPVAGEPGAGAAAAGSGVAQPSGVVSPEATAGQPAGGEAAAPNTLTAQILDSIGISPRSVVRKELIGKAVDDPAVAARLTDLLNNPNIKSKPEVAAKIQEFLGQVKPKEVAQKQAAAPVEQAPTEEVAVEAPPAKQSIRPKAEPAPAVNLNGRNIPVEISPSDRAAGDVLTTVNTDAFDAAWKSGDKFNNFYIGSGGTGAAIGNRYQQFGNFVNTAKSIEAPTVSVDENGVVAFGNGRHRFAFMRDQGAKAIPVSMSQESFQNAVKAGYVQPAQKKSLREEAATEEEKAQPEAAPSVKERLEQVDKEIADRLEKLGKLLQARLSKFGLKDVGVQVIRDLEAGGEYANRLIKLAIDVANPIREIRHEAIHALKELGFFTPQQWSVLEKQAKDKWIDEYLKNRNVNMEPLAEGQQSRFDAYTNLFATQGLTEDQANEAMIEEAIADAFGVFDANKAPPGLMQALLERMRKFFNAVKETFGGTGTETAEDIFRKIERGEAAPTISEPSKSEQAFSLRQRNFDNPADRIEVSTAKPSAANPVPGEFVPRDPIADLYVIDSADIMSIPAHFAAAHNAISGYNWFPVSTDPDANVRAMKDTIVDNLVWLHNLVPADIRARAKLWYDGANRIANDWAKGYKYTPQQISGTLAVLSPQKDWFMNVSLAERLISIYTERQNQAWTPAMTAWAESYVKASRSIDTKTNRQEVLDAAKRLEGKKLGELSNEDAAYFIRVFDETYNPRQYRVVTPEGQFGGFVGVNEQVDDEAAEEGQQAGHVAWGTYDSIAKGVAILRDGSFNNISDQLGEEHKVRNFYNNIVNPKDAIGSVTIDTHAIAAASMKALSGSSLEVLHNFGTTPKAAAGAGGSKLTGASGIYGFVADAYREAAAKVSTPENPVLAREMQSITWEAIRSIFPAAWKRQNAKDVEAVYDQFKQGKITLGEARDRVYKMSGGLKGFAWEGQKQGVYASDGASSFDRSLPKDLKKVQGRTLEPYQIREKISVNLSAAGFEIPGIAFLYSRASSGDMAAYTLLQEAANDSVRFLLAGNESVVIKSIPTSGLFDFFYEPSLNLIIAFNEGERESVLPALRRFSENFRQKQFHVRQRLATLDPNDLDNAGKYLEREFPDGSYATPVFTFKLAAPLSNQEMADIVSAAGVPGVTFNDNEVITYFVRSKKNETADTFYEQVLRLSEQIGDIATEVNFSAERLWVYGEGEGVSRRYGAIRGEVRPGNPVASRTAKRVAAYVANVEEKKLKTFAMQEVTAEQDAKQTAIGDLYGMMPVNDLDNPLVKRAYSALANELRRQYQALPIRVEWSKKKDKEGRPTDAYGSKSDAMRKDILEYNRLRILPTTPESFGPPGVDFTGHPLLEKTGVMIEGKELVYNDMLRAVHDYYAHGASRATFGRMGEEAAWKNHMAMTSDPLARWALTTETRAQNSWVNFRSDLDRNIPAKKRPFADQKAGLLPIEFAMTGDAKVDAPIKKLKAELNKKERLGSMANVKATPKASLRAPQTEAFNQWFGESKIVNPDGTPKVMYHGTARDITTFKPKQAGAIFLTDSPNFAANFANMSAKWMANHADQFLTPEQLKKGRSDAIKAIRKENRADPNFAKELIDDIDNPQAQYYLEATEYLAKEYIKYLPSGPNIMPMFVRAVKPFDYQNPEHMAELRNYAITSRYADERLPNRLRLIEMGRWEEIESPAAQSAIMSLGFDGFYVEEGGVKNLAVYSSNQLKSATGNVGAYGKRPIEQEEAARFGMTADEAAQAQKKGDIRFSLRSEGGPPTRENVLGAMKMAQEKQPYTNCQLCVQMATGVSKLRDLPKVKTARIGDIYTFNETKNMASHYAIDVGDGDVVEVEAWGEEVRVIPLSEVADEYGEPSAIRRPPEDAYTQSVIKASLRAPQTEAFKRWFGDSKVVDTEGKPLVVYHGTNTDITSFEINKIGTATDGGLLGAGFYFTKNPELAESYALQTTGIFGGEENILPVYVSIKKPFYSGSGSAALDLMRKLAGGSRPVSMSSPAGVAWAQKLREGLIALGYDGVIDTSDGAAASYANEIVAFYPEQIKSAIGNIGTFDAKNPDIRYSLRDSIGLYSELESKVAQGPNKAPAASWKAYINGLTQKGVKPEEIEWSGVRDWLDLQTGPVTKDAVNAYLKQGGVKVEETMLGGRFALPKKLQDYVDYYGGETNSTSGLLAIAEEAEQDAQRFQRRGNTEKANELFEIAELANQQAERGETGAQATSYGRYTLPGGENYREVLLTLPGGESIEQAIARRDATWEKIKAKMPDGLHPLRQTVWAEENVPDLYQEWQDASRVANKRTAESDTAYRSSHWDQPNVIAHIRLNDRTDADGKRVLFVEEIQSDWGQEGKKKGFASPKDKENLAAMVKQYDQLVAERRAVNKEMAELPDFNERFAELQDKEANISKQLNELSDKMSELRSAITAPIPAAPFVTKTEGWLNLALKRIMVMAAEGGYDKVAFVNGEQSADRYDLSKRIMNIAWRGGDFRAYDHDGNAVIERTGTSQQDVADLVGKEVADRLFNQTPKGEGRNALYVLQGQDLKVGGEGMKTFYNQIVPIAVKKLLPKVGGGQMGVVDLGSLKTTFSDGAWRVFDNALNGYVGPDSFATQQDAQNWVGKQTYSAKDPASQPGFDVTPDMKRKVETTGLPRFSLRGASWNDSRVETLLNKYSYLQNGREKDTKAYAAFVKPEDFLAATTPVSDRERLESEKTPLDVKRLAKEDQEIFLDIKSTEEEGVYQITGHEGRHRMMALRDAGINSVPVVFYTGGTKNAEIVEEPYFKSQEHRGDKRLIKSQRGFSAMEMIPINWEQRNNIKETFGGEAKVKFSLRSQLPASAVAAVDRTTVPRDEKTFVERISSAFSSEGFSWFRAQALNRYNRLSEYDKALAKKMGGTRLLADSSAEAAALFSDLGAGLTEEVFGARDRIGGIPVYRNGVTVVDNKNGTIKGPLAIFAPLLELSNGDPYIFQTYQFWAGQKRGKRLDAQGKLTPFTAADAVEAQRIERQFPQFKKIQAEWIKFNDGLVDYLVDTGVISRQNAAEFKRYSDYLPFYKQMLGEVTQGPKIFQSIAGVTPPKKYKGSKEGQLDDFLETIIRNVQSSIQSGIKNVASQRAADVATQIGQAFNVTEELNNANTQRTALLNAGVPNTDPRIVQLNQDIYTLRQQLTGATTFVVLKNGVENVYRSSDPLFIDAIKSLNIPDLPFIGLLSAPSNLLRNLVTKDPAFMLANMMRDSMSAWVTSGVKMTPMIDTARNFASAIANKSPIVEALYKGGIIGGYDYASTMEASGRKFGQEIRKETKLLTRGEKLAKPFTSVWEALEKGTQASDAATRAEIYKKTLEATKSAKYPNGNEAEALFRALEVMNFNRKGRSAVVRILTAAVPFLNARMQGLDVLYRTAIQPFFDKNATNEAKAIQKTFFVRGMTIMALSAMYWALTHDDDDYKKQEQETRDNFWLIPSMGVKIPIPFEIGVMFKVIPERIMAYTFGTDTGKDFMESMKRQFQSTFMFTGIPQAALPIYEVKTNHSFFTQRPIIGQGMENVADKYQIGPTTSRISQMIGEELNLSPMQLDHLIKGYTGTLGMYAVDLFDAIYDMNSDAPKAAKRFEQMPIIKRFAVDPQARGAVSAYYQLKNSVDEVVRTTNFLERSMRFDEYAEYLNENANVLAVRDYISDMEKSMKEIREARALVSSSQMSAIDKRESLKNLTDVENALNANIQQVKMIAYKKGG